MPTIIEELAIALGYKVDNKPLDDAEKKAKEAADRVSASWKKIGDTAAKAGAAGLAAVGGLTALAAKAASAGAAIDDAAKRSGASSKDIQRLGYAAEQSGGSTEGLIVSLKFLSKSIVDARNASSPAAKALKDLGVNLSEIDGKSAEVQFEVLADAFKKVDDSALKTDLALTIFGKAGGELIPLLDEGAAGVKKLGDELTNMGGVLDEAAIAKAAEFDDQLAATKKQLGAFVNQIGIDLIPIIQDGIKDWQSWAVVIGGVGVAIGGLKLVALAHDIGLVGTSLAAVKWSTGIAGALALGVAFGTAMDNALGLSDAIAGLNESGKRSENVNLSDVAPEDRQRLADAVARRDKYQTGVDSAISSPAIVAARDAAQAEIDSITGSAAKRSQDRKQGRALINAGGRIFDKLSSAGAAAGSGIVDRVGVRASQVGEFVSSGAKAVKSGRRERKKGGAGKSAEQRQAEQDLADAYVQLATEGIDEDLRALGVRSGATDKAIKESIGSAAASLAGGASKKVARGAGVSSLSGFVGADLSKRQSDPLLSAIFGEDQLPDVPLSELERGQQPQVLIATINNTNNVSIPITVNGTGDPGNVAELTRNQFEALWTEKIVAVAKFSKVNFR
jgi:hypothetical protein